MSSKEEFKFKFMDFNQEQDDIEAIASSFKFIDGVDGDKNKIVTGQVSYKVQDEGNTFSIFIEPTVNDKINAGPADFLKKIIGSHEINMLHARSMSRLPTSVAFAIKFTISIHGVEHLFGIGQGKDGLRHPWYLCSPAIIAKEGNQAGYISNKFYLEAEGSYAYVIKPQDEINSGVVFGFTGATHIDDYTAAMWLETDGKKEFRGNSHTNVNSIAQVEQGEGNISRWSFRKKSLKVGYEVSDNDTWSIKPVANFTVQPYDEQIDGPSVTSQSMVGMTPTKDSIINYGVSYGVYPQHNQTYCYVGPNMSDWVTRILTAYPDVKVSDLVMAGSHDAGMWVVSKNDFSKASHLIKLWELLGGIVLTEILTNLEVTALTSYLVYLVEKHGVDLALGNFAITQKDTAYNQLATGARFFDFRPGYPTGSDMTDDNVTHIHSVIPGAKLKDFLSDVDSFLAKHPNEIVVINFKDNGIDSGYYHTISADKLSLDFVDVYVRSTKYKVVASFNDKIKVGDVSASVADTAISDLIKNQTRLLIVHGTKDQNGSYDDNSYATSLTDPSSIINKLSETLDNAIPKDEPESFDELNVLQLQCTPSAIVAKAWKKELKHIFGWAEALLASEQGNLQQCTKPDFDLGTYNWLFDKAYINNVGDPLNIPDCFAAARGSFVLLNDFVDVSLSYRALALTLHRLKSKKIMIAEKDALDTN